MTPSELRRRTAAAHGGHGVRIEALADGDRVAAEARPTHVMRIGVTSEPRAWPVQVPLGRHSAEPQQSIVGGNWLTSGLW